MLVFRTTTDGFSFRHERPGQVLQSSLILCCSRVSSHHHRHRHRLLTSPTATTMVSSIVCFTQPLQISISARAAIHHHHSFRSRRRAVNHSGCKLHLSRVHNCRAVLSCHDSDFSISPLQLDVPDGVHSLSPHAELSSSEISESVSDSTLNPTYDSGGSGGIGSDGGNGSGNGGSSGGGGSGDANEPDDSSLPSDMKAALAYGSLTKPALQRYYECLKHPFLRALLAIPAFRSRFLMDPQFLFKLLVQEIVGNGTSLAGEIVVRGNDIVHELEYVASDLIVGTVIEAAFVWLLTPTLTLPTSSSASPIARYLSSLPANIFQPSTALQSFTPAQRFVSFFYSAGQYAFIGFLGGVVGTAITYGLLETRKRLDKSYKPMRPMPPVIPNSLGWAAFMGVSCNTRFQFVEGLEMGVAKMFGGTSEALVNWGIIALRFMNNYYGGVQFVQFFRAIGLHATAEHEETPTEQIKDDQQMFPKAAPQS